MFCPNCGKKCDSGLFCWNCGTRLPVAEPTPAARLAEPHKAAPAPKPVPEPLAAKAPSGTGPEPAEGAILTNIKALAAKFGTGTETLLRLLEAYIEAARSRGIRYHLIDASDYQWLNPDARSGSRSRLTPSDSWTDHIALLADYFRYGRSKKQEESNYLFIIGGDDIVPMPVMPHYMENNPNFEDRDIDTDIPYAYLLGQRTAAMLLSGELFNYEQYFHVGRLPFATDSTLDDLAGYLHRATRSGGTIRLKSYYGQVNLPWGDDSQAVCEPIRETGLSAAADLDTNYATIGNNRIPFAQNGLYYSIPVVDQNTRTCFDPQADLYYFNLHGSDAPTMSGFIADYDQSAYQAVMPAHLATIQTPNLLVTEACYGAKFMDYERRQTMLLTAISNQTLLYLGSSRCAFCNNRYVIDNSDRLANIFLASLLDGHTAGEALYLARRSFFEYDDGRLYDQQKATIVEFNLFGDPFLRAHTAQCQSRSLPAAVSVLTTRPVYGISDRECLRKSASTGTMSLLDEVRGAVDRNLMRIREVVDRTLYERLGTAPRRLDTIFRNRFGDGTSFYSFDYVEPNPAYKRLHSVITTPEGAIKTIISTK